MCPTCTVYKGACHAMQFAVCSIFNQNLISDSTYFGACTSSAPVLFLAECLFLFLFSISISSLINHTVAAFLWNIGRRSTINREKDRLFSCPAVSFHALCEGFLSFFCHNVQWEPVGCQYVFTWMPARQILPFCFMMKVFVWKRAHWLIFSASGSLFFC